MRATFSSPGSSEGFWLTRLAYGLILGAAIATLDFAHYFPLVSLNNVAPIAFGSMLLEWCGEGVLLALLIGVAERLTLPRGLSGWQLALAVVLSAVAAVVAWQSFAVLLWRGEFEFMLFRDYLGTPVNWISGVFYHGWLMLFFGGLAAAVYVSQKRRARMLAALHTAEFGRAKSQQQLAEARLGSLQARVDPDFLLQTLSRLERAYESEPQAADRLLDELIVFLRAALADIRHNPTISLG